ncbi:ephrin type-B receptor 6 isoform X2 [Chlorocebus sabaeus]|uniref:ephrin type-B receptor 6 isoform X2 n=1 Tax=Chlorocebus sabaeus TaxID=60711 RepID=UPI003BF9DFCA
MATEGAAQLENRVAGMVCSLWVLLLVSSVLALEEVLLDTTGETSEIGWLTYPPGGWDEVSVLDDQRRLTRTFEACHVAGAPPGTGQDNWLQTHFVERRGAQRAHIRLHFSVRACSSLGVSGGTCRETFTLYYRQAEEPDSPDSVSSWHLKRWTKVDTIAADESFPSSSSSSSSAAWAVGPHGAGQRAGLQLNVKERSFGPLTQRGFYVAFQDTGACLALVAVRLFSYTCPAVLRSFASFPETKASGAGGASLVAAVGTCVAHAEPEEDGVGGQAGGSPPRLHCNGEGKWMVAVGGCLCQPGHQPARGDKACQVPSAVPVVHQVSRASNSITVSWPQPDQTNGNILDYQLRYYDQAEDESHSFTLTSETNTATVTQLSPGHIYGFQVRARTAAGHGPYGGKVYFQTLPQGELSSQLPERLSLVIGSILGALAFLLLAAITVLAVVFQRKRRGTGYTEQLQQYSSPGPGVKYYIDPSTYEDPCQAIRELAREIDPAYIKIEEVIGTGSFGEVRRGRLQPRGRREQTVAIQALWAGGAESLQMTFLGRAAVLGQFQHPNILRLEGVVTKSRPLMVLTEFMELGPLDSFLRQREGQFSSLQLVAMQRGVAAAMQYLSSFAFVHRSLSAHSVLVNSHLVCKVARLGHSPQGPSCLLRWAAPEVIAHGKHTASSDVWSFGILMWEVMSYGERPYWDMSEQEVLNAIEQEFRLPPPPGCPPGLHLLMLDTWQKDRARRPHFDQLVAAFDKMIRKPDTLQAGGDPGERPSQALLTPVALDFPCLDSPQAWLSAIGLECYQDNFSKFGLCTFSGVAQLSLEDLPALGITLAGHQKKLLHHIQLLQQHLRQQGSVEV